MPMDRSKYPDDWEAISHRIRFERAGGRCEWPGCGAPHGEMIRRRRDDPERWILDVDHRSEEILADLAHAKTMDLRESAFAFLDRFRYLVFPGFHAPVRVVLTVAHKDHDTTNNADDNLAAWCQRHHLRWDARFHADNARATRSRKAARGQATFLAEGPAHA